MDGWLRWPWCLAGTPDERPDGRPGSRAVEEARARSGRAHARRSNLVQPPRADRREVGPAGTA